MNIKIRHLFSGILQRIVNILNVFHFEIMERFNSISFTIREIFFEMGAFIYYNFITAVICVISLGVFELINTEFSDEFCIANDTFPEDSVLDFIKHFWSNYCFQNQFRKAFISLCTLFVYLRLSACPKIFLSFILFVFIAYLDIVSY